MQTYIERDVQQLIKVKDLNAFRTLLRICAGRAGQIVNLSGMGNDCGISHNTAKEWLSVLEASYIVFQLPPHFNNFSKRLIKSPKLYLWCDNSGLEIDLIIDRGDVLLPVEIKAGQTITRGFFLKPEKMAGLGRR